MFGDNLRLCQTHRLSREDTHLRFPCEQMSVSQRHIHERWTKSGKGSAPRFPCSFHVELTSKMIDLIVPVIKINTNSQNQNF